MRKMRVRHGPRGRLCSDLILSLVCASLNSLARTEGSTKTDVSFTGSNSWIPFEIEYLVYITIALAFATLSSYLTITFTNSTNFETKKNVAVSDSEGKPIGGGEMGKPRKVMYFAAGSGIPEIKAILSVS